MSQKKCDNIVSPYLILHSYHSLSLSSAHRASQAVANLRKMVMQKQEAETREARARVELERRAREAAEVCVSARACV